METTNFEPSLSEAELIVLDPTGIRTIPLGRRRSWTFGRPCPGNNPDIKIDSPIAGRKQGEFTCWDGEWYYKDGGSRNGTIFNNSLLQSQENHAAIKRLYNGDIIRVDNHNLNAPDERGVWAMFCTDGTSGTWKTVKLREESTIFIGRSPEYNHVVLDKPYISRQHARIDYSNGYFYITDNNSNAGTFLNGKRIARSIQLREKDVISMCDFHMIVARGYIIYNARNTQVQMPVSQIGGAARQAKRQRYILRADIQTKQVPNKVGPGMKEIIRDIRVDVGEGTLVALLGAAGSGKSTFMNCLNGMDQNGVVGNVMFANEDLYRNFDRLKYMIGSVPQENVFHSMITVDQELSTAARLRPTVGKETVKERVDRVVRMLGIEAVRKSKISTLSGGEKKRVNIGIELVADRSLLCLDEPDAGLDPKTKKELFMMLRELAHTHGKSILVIIHDVSDIDLFDQIIMLTKKDNVGRLSFSGSPEEAKKHYKVNSVKEIYDLVSKNPERYVKESSTR